MAITFSDLGNPAPNGNLLIVDGLNIAFRWKHQGVLDFKYDYIRTVESLAKSYNAGQIIVLADGGSSWRKEIFPRSKKYFSRVHAVHSLECTDRRAVHSSVDSI